MTRGGSDGIENLVFACWSCNDEKNTTPGWLFALRKCWEFVWPDQFVKSTLAWDLTSLSRERIAKRHGNKLGFPSAPRRHGS